MSGMSSGIQGVIVQAALVAAAGAVGTLARHGGTALAARVVGTALPWGTLAVNVAGAFACGAMLAFARSRELAPATEAALIVGLLGGFTTYSSFAVQSVEMLAAGRVTAAVVYVAATLVIGFAAAWAGLRCFG